MSDVIVVGAGPAGSVAALVLARAGARVCLLERARLPRSKLCGDTLNPGAIATLERLGMAGGPLASAVRLRGIRLTSPRIDLSCAYPGQEVALALPRAGFDQWLAEAAVAAGARLDTDVRVTGPVWGGAKGAEAVTGVETASAAGTARISAAVTIAADGRRSILARAAGLSHYPATPRRWAFGAYAEDVDGMIDMGEMHVRAGHYVGLAPVGAGVTNVCVVTGPRPAGRSPEDIIRRVLAADVGLRERTSGLRLVAPPQVLGPLATDCDVVGTRGLLLAGDAAGFVDPMTGDGVHLAIRGGLLAAEAALRALETGDADGAVAGLAARRRVVLGRKLRFNRSMRRITASSALLDIAGMGGRAVPGLLRRLVQYAGDAAWR